MPRRFTLGDLVTRAKQRCDMEGQDSISTSEWKFYLSTAYADLYSTVCESGLRYFETTTTVIATGAASYDEPQDHLSTVGISRVVDAEGGRTPLYELMAQERDMFAGQTGDAVAYMHVDDLLYLFPRPSSGSYIWSYVPQPPDLTSGLDADSIDVVTPDGESLVIWGAAVMALAKQESDVQLARAERNEARGRVMNWATLRSLHSPRRSPVGEGNPYWDPADWRYG